MTTQGLSPALQQLIKDDAVRQLRQQNPHDKSGDVLDKSALYSMATLGSEDGALKLDWVEGVQRLLADNAMLEQVEAEARAIWERGIRHIIWAGMGGSIMAVRVLIDLGFCSNRDNGHVTIYPLDSTDPAALNEIVRKIAKAKNLALPAGEEASNPAFLRALLGDVMMVGVSMGMTSEEPITHLEWFTELLKQTGLRPAEHLLVMTLPGSYLDRFAEAQQAPSLPLQLDRRTGTGGRMSAPTTRVFLLPAALYLTRLSGEPGQLRTVLHRAWDEYNLDLATERPADHPFVQLAAALSDAPTMNRGATDGVCRLLLSMPEGWQPLVPWIEQLMEESLGKGGKGVVVFDDQFLTPTINSLMIQSRSGALDHQSQSPLPLISPSARCEAASQLELIKLFIVGPSYRSSGTLQVRVVTDLTQPEEKSFNLYQPYLAWKEPLDRLVAVAASFLGWQLSMALYGYLHRITFAGQPAVENYKARARVLRTQDDPLQVTKHWAATTIETDPSSGIAYSLLAPQTVESRFIEDLPQEGRFIEHVPRFIVGETQVSPASLFARTLQRTATASPGYPSLGYLDLTINGELPSRFVSALDAQLRTIGNELLGVPVKLRRAPAAYHSTEQSEMDGPPFLVSLRVLARDHEKSILGNYTDTFLCAQAVSTWQAMMEQGRPCFLLIIDSSIDDAVEPLHRFFSDIAAQLGGQ